MRRMSADALPFLPSRDGASRYDELRIKLATYFIGEPRARGFDAQWAEEYSALWNGKFGEITGGKWDGYTAGDRAFLTNGCGDPSPEVRAAIRDLKENGLEHVPFEIFQEQLRLTKRDAREQAQPTPA